MTCMTLVWNTATRFEVQPRMLELKPRLLNPERVNPEVREERTEPELRINWKMVTDDNGRCHLTAAWHQQ